MKRTSKLALTLGVVGLVLILVGSTGCKKKNPGLTTPTTVDTGAAQPGGASGEGMPGLSADEMAAKIWDPATGVRTVYFDYDRSDLRPDARETLQHNAEVINSAPGPMILIAGHCDERGTQEYNLALGERRAQAARDYLIQLGVPAERLITVSYGEEQPADPGHNESAWARNRRAEFLQSR